MHDPIRMTWREYRRRECLYYGRRVSLSPRMTELLSILLIRRGSPVSEAELIEMLWPDPDAQPDTADNCVRVHLFILRKRLPGLIRFHTRKSGFGWTIDIPARLDAAA